MIGRVFCRVPLHSYFYIVSGSLYLGLCHTTLHMPTFNFIHPNTYVYLINAMVTYGEEGFRRISLMSKTPMISPELVKSSVSPSNSLFLSKAGNSTTRSWSRTVIVIERMKSCGATLDG